MKKKFSFKFISILMVAVFSLSQAKGPVYQHLAPATLAKPATSNIVIPESYSRIQKQRAKNIIRDLKNFPRGSYGNSLLETLQKTEFDDIAQFREESAPFELLLMIGYPHHVAASAYRLLWQKAPTPEEKNRLLEILINHYNSNLGTYWKVTFSFILIHSDLALLSSFAISKLEELLLTFENTHYDGFFMGNSLSLRDNIIQFFVNHPYCIQNDVVARRIHPFVLESFRAHPNSAQFQFLMQEMFWDPVSLEGDGRIEALADDLIDYIENAFEPYSIPELEEIEEEKEEEASNNSNGNTFLSFITDFLRISRFNIEALSGQLRDSNTTHSFTLRRKNLSHDQNGTIQQAEVSFRGWPLNGEPVRYAVGKRDNQDEALIEVNGRQLLISFNQTFRGNPPSLILERQNSSGELITEEFYFNHNGTLNFYGTGESADSGILIEDTVGAFYIQDETLFVDLSALYQLFLIQEEPSFLLNAFYGNAVAPPESSLQLNSFNPFTPIILFGLMTQSAMTYFVICSLLIAFAAGYYLIEYKIDLLKKRINKKWEYWQDVGIGLLFIIMLPIFFAVIFTMMLLDPIIKKIRKLYQKYRMWKMHLMKDLPLEMRIWNFLNNSKFAPPLFHPADQALVAERYEEIDLTFYVGQFEKALVYSEHKRRAIALELAESVIRTYSFILNKVKAEPADLEIFARHLLHAYLLKSYLLLQLHQTAEAAKTLNQTVKLIEAFPITRAGGFALFSIPVQVYSFRDQLDQRMVNQPLFEFSI